MKGNNRINMNENEFLDDLDDLGDSDDEEEEDEGEMFAKKQKLAGDLADLDSDEDDGGGNDEHMQGKKSAEGLNTDHTSSSSGFDLLESA